MATRTTWCLIFGLMLTDLAGCSDSEILGRSGDAGAAADVADGKGDVPPPECSTDDECAATRTLELCQQAFCDAGTCQVRDTIDCCATDGDCPLINDACLSNICPIPGSRCQTVDVCSVPCDSDTQCEQTAPACALSAQCVAEQCAYDTRTCCFDDGQCQAVDGCTTAACVDNVCSVDAVATAPCCPAPPTVATSFSNPVDVIVSSTAPDVGWLQTLTPFTPTPGSALWLRDSAGGYSSAQGAYEASARFDLGPVAAGQAIDVRFRTFVDVRPDPTIDRFTVYLEWSHGAQQPLYAKTEGTLGQWNVVTTTGSSSPLAGSVALIFAFEGGTSTAASGKGIAIDDLVIHVGCGQGLDCVQDGDCPSSGPCSVGTCVAGTCSETAVTGCCISDGDCSGLTPDICSTPVCEQNQCAWAPKANCCVTGSDCPQVDLPCVVSQCVDNTCELNDIPGCCTSDEDCPQIDADTACLGPNVCISGQCTPSEPPPNCCDSASECDDDDACTVDACVENACQNTFIEGCGCVGVQCCTEWVFAENFDANPTDWVFENTDAATGWKLWPNSPVAISPPATLYYGNTDTLNYQDLGESGSAGIATSPTIVMPSTAEAIVLSFQLFADIEPIEAFDQLFVYAQSESGASSVVYAKPPTGLTMNSFQNIEVDVTSFAGDTVRLVFSFDTVDAISNEGLGVIIDDIRIKAACPACASNDVCDDNDPCTEDLCLDGICLNTPLDAAGCGGCDLASCDDGNPCTLNACDEDTGLCSSSPKLGACDDGDPCTNADQCVDGTCLGVAIVCTDGIVCTEDSCDPSGKCVFKPVNGCCASDFDCQSPEPCTEGSCELSTGTCLLTTVTPCCQGPEDCVDGNLCTQDVCSNGVCDHVPIANCCQSDLDCISVAPCTTGTCQLATGACQFVVDDDCCTPGTACDDGDPCTDNDTCAPSGQCAGTAVAGCCATDIDCDDGNPCSSDSCAGGQCSSNFDPFCCTGDSECDDGNTCTIDSCLTLGGFGICQYAPGTAPECCLADNDCPAKTCQNANCQQFQCVYAVDPTCCTSDAQCDDLNACTQDTCSNGVCLNTPEGGCCTSDVDCIDGDPCTLTSCDTSSNTCATVPDPSCCSTDADCDDGNPCTTGECQPDGQCLQSPFVCADDGDPCTLETCNTTFGCIALNNPACCADGSSCDDGDPCTFDFCSVTGQCAAQPIDACCLSDADCDDADPCTDEFCNPDNQCTSSPSTACCSSDSDCDDGDPCTDQTCIPGSGCVYSPAPQCCASSAECDDGNLCTVDTCTNGVCTNAEIDGCCEQASDCDDANPCTFDACNNGVCAYTLDVLCCQADGDCDDDNPCTADTCASFLQFGVCQFTPIPGPQCCINETNCSPSACESASCINFQCSYDSVADCCSSNAECNDGDPCTQDLCNDGTCFNAATGECCTSSFDCDDSDACTTDSCDLSTGLCASSAIAGCCAIDQDCDDGIACTIDQCDVPKGVCSSVAGPQCCLSNGDCDDADPCTQDLCNTGEGTCSHSTITGCCQPSFSAWSFDSEAPLDDWNISPPQNPGEITWWVTQTRAASPPSSLYMGNPLAGDFSNGNQQVTNAAITTTFEVPSTPFATLAFEIWADTEFAVYDELLIAVVTSAGTQVIWSKNESLPSEAYRSWQDQKVDLTPWSGEVIQLSFGFDSIDGIANDGEGIFIDNIAIVGTCEATDLCETSADCDDNNVCTVDSCQGNVCINAPQSGCCTADDDCNDSDVCTINACVGGSCEATEVAGCCTQDAECDDGLDCTADTCDGEANTCLFTPTESCCDSDSDCDDGDACTVNSCSGGVCESTASSSPACCTEESWFFTNFDAGDVGDFVILGDGSPVGWTTGASRSWSAPLSLYYGDPLAGNYDSGATTFGSAFSPLISIPATAQKPTLTFQLFADIEVVASRDRLTIALLINGTQQAVWTKADLPPAVFGQWHTVQVALPEASKGANVRVVLAFDSVDAVNNGGEGIYIDDMRLLNTCD